MGVVWIGTKGNLIAIVDAVVVRVSVLRICTELSFFGVTQTVAVAVFAIILNGNGNRGCCAFV